MVWGDSREQRRIPVEETEALVVIVDFAPCGPGEGDDMVGAKEEREVACGAAAGAGEDEIGAGDEEGRGSDVGERDVRVDGVGEERRGERWEAGARAAVQEGQEVD